MIARSQLMADDRKRLQTSGEDRTWFYLLRSSAITIAGSQTIAEVCFHMIRTRSQNILRSAIRDRPVCDHMETSLKFMACNIQNFSCAVGRDKHCAKFLTPWSQKPCRGILIYFAWFAFYSQLNFFPPAPSFVYDSRKNRKNHKRRHCLWATLYRHLLAKFELKRLKTRCTPANLKRAPNFLNI